MKSPSPHFRLALRAAGLALALLACSASAPALAGDDWQPIDPADLAIKTPTVEPDADAEVLLWDVRIDDDREDLVFKHYIRIKVFTERGRESQSRIDIPYLSKYVQIKDVAGRTVKADGTVAELKKEDVFERDIVKANGLKLKAKSFAMPGVEPGAVIEYRWREVRPGAMVRYQRLALQREIPIRKVTYHVKPLQSPYFPFGMRYMPFRLVQNRPFEKEKDGFFAITQENVPAFREEPHMPPEDQVRTWVLIYYSPDRQLEPARFWKEVGREQYDAYKSRLKANDEVKRKAAEIVGDAATDEQKLERLYEFCRTQIKNVDDDISQATAEQKEKAREVKPAHDILKRGFGDASDVRTLFGALATAAGFDARVALTAGRDDIFFDPNFADEYFINTASVAVRLGDKWRFFDPGYSYLPFGMLRWQAEGTPTLITDPKDPQFVVSSVSSHEKTLQKRTASLKLSEDGTLEGDVRVEYTGQYAVEMKEFNDDDSPEEREETLKNRVRARLASAEVTAVRIENVTDYAKPFVYQYHVRVPGYAQRTGKRLFLRPAFFQYGAQPLFPTSTRRNAIYFHHPWSEEDHVEITLPEGYALDNAEAPSPYGANQVSQYLPKLSVTKDGRTLIYDRKFYFDCKTADGSYMVLPATSYGQAKNYFDEVHKQDEHTISLKQAAATTAAKP